MHIRATIRSTMIARTCPRYRRTSRGQPRSHVGKQLYTFVNWQNMCVYFLCKPLCFRLLYAQDGAESLRRVVRARQKEILDGSDGRYCTWLARDVARSGI